jgi:hypothetical protein
VQAAFVDPGGTVMPDGVWIILVILGTGLILVLGLWMLIPILAGLPWRPTSPERTRQALTLAQVRPGEVVVDLGSGDGRLLIQAAQEFRARAVGIEISPLHCLFSLLSVRFHGVQDLVQVRLGNFYTAELGDADVVLAYITSAQVPRLRPHLEGQCSPGVRIVTIAYNMEGWEPLDIDTEHLLFLYQMPPKPGSVETFLAQQLKKTGFNPVYPVHPVRSNKRKFL